MDNRITKERVNIHLEYDWIKYIALLAVAVLVFALLYTMLAPRLKTYEEIKFLSLTYTATSNDASQDEFKLMRNYMLDEFEKKNGDTAIKDVLIESMADGGQGFGEWLTTRLISNFDFVIAPAYFFIYDENKPDEERIAYEGNLASAVVKFKDWQDTDNVPYIDTETDNDETARGMGFKDAAQMKAALLFNPQNECIGFKLNGFNDKDNPHGIDQLFPAIRPLDGGEGVTEFAVGVLQSGGNIGYLNSQSKRDKKKGVDTFGHNEALDALKFFIQRYSGQGNAA